MPHVWSSGLVSLFFKLLIRDRTRTSAEGEVCASKGKPYANADSWNTDTDQWRVTVAYALSI